MDTIIQQLSERKYAQVLIYFFVFVSIISPVYTYVFFEYKEFFVTIDLMKLIILSSCFSMPFFAFQTFVFQSLSQIEKTSIAIYYTKDILTEIQSSSQVEQNQLDSNDNINSLTKEINEFICGQNTYLVCNNKNLFKSYKQIIYMLNKNLKLFKSRLRAEENQQVREHLEKQISMYTGYKITYNKLIEMEKINIIEISLIKSAIILYVVVILITLRNVFDISLNTHEIIFFVVFIINTIIFLYNNKKCSKYKHSESC